MVGTTTMTIPTTRRPSVRYMLSTVTASSASRKTSGASSVQDPSITGRAGGLASRGLKMLSIAQPVSMMITAEPSPGSADPAQDAPGIIAVEIAIAKPSGDQGSDEMKPRWIASSMRRVLIPRITGSASPRADCEASPPRSEIEP